MRALKLALLLSAMVLGCGAARPQPDEPAAGARPHSKRAGQSGGGSVPALAATELAKVPSGTYGPYLGSRSEGHLALWAAPDKQGRGWYSLALGTTGGRIGKVLRIGAAPSQVGLVAVKPLGGAARSGSGDGGASLTSAGFVVAFTQAGDSPEIRAATLGLRGELRGGPTLLGQPEGKALWIDAVATEDGALVLWAVQHDDRATLYARPLGGAAEVLGEVQIAVQDARAWQAVGIPGGAAIAAVLAGSEPAAAGPVKLYFIDTAAAPVTHPTVVSPEPTAGLDVDLVRVGSSLVMAWSDRRRIEPKIYVAATGPRGKLTRAPSPVTRGIGEEALVQLVAPFNAAGPGYLVWERVSQRRGAGREIRLAPVNADGSVGRERAAVTMAADDSVPEFKATAQGVAALTLASACPKQQSCESSPTLPTFVQFDAQLKVVASEPMRLDALSGSGASLAWGLTCPKSHCLALAAIKSSPAPIFAVRLEAKSALWKPAGNHVQRPPPPRAVSVEAVVEVDPIHDLQLLKVGDGALAAWVTYFDPATPYRRPKRPAPDGRFAPLRALLQVQAAQAAHGGVTEAHTVSLRARSLAGVQLASGRPGHDEALLVWSAIDGGHAQVFLTLVDATGQKKAQRMLTNRRGEVSDVAAANAGDGWLVAWVDERSGDPEVYATHVKPNLRRDAPEQRLTSAPGAATGVCVQPLGEAVQVVWADARDSEHPGWADIYGVRVRPRDAAPVGQAQPLATNRTHSFVPVLSPFGGGLLLAWLEASGGEDRPQSKPGVRIAQLDTGGRFVAPPKRVQTLRGAPTSLTLDCAEQACHVVVSVDTTAGSELQGFVYRDATVTRVRKLATLTGPPGQPVAPALRGDLLYYSDQTSSGQGRINRMIIEWE